VHRDIYDQFKSKFVDLTRAYKIGDKMNEETNMGPMITEGEATRVEQWVKEAVDKGATVLTGGNHKGALYEPTVLENVPTDAAVHCEEVFGPTVNLYAVDDLDEAIKQANSLPYGLLAAVFTRDVEVAFKAAYELDCGGVMINDSTDYRLDSMPFGGVKYSGLGREGLKFSLQEMTEPKVICFNLPGI
jgi:glyceraldehyde-3-phosphate dehydrogenase (NADP+)